MTNSPCDELEHVVAAVEVDQLVGADLGDDVTGAVVAVGVEHFGGDLGPLVVAGEHRLGLDQQLAARIRPVGAEVAQVGNVDQLVVDHRRAADTWPSTNTTPASVEP